MSAFYRDANNHLTIDGLPLDGLMAEFGSPLYVYSGAGLERAFTAFQAAVAPVSGKVHFALKANSALGVIALLARCGAGADIVSAGELARALAAGIAAKDVVFSGVGKARQISARHWLPALAKSTQNRLKRWHKSALSPRQWGL